MRHIPRHLLLATVFVAVCCADGGAIDFDRAQAVAGRCLATTDQTARGDRLAHPRHDRIRPAAVVRATLVWAAVTPVAPTEPTFEASPLALVRLSFDELRLPPPTA